MITMCPYCNLDTAGNHEWNCPNNLKFKKEFQSSEIPQGWQCPICKEVYAWYVNRCPNHGPKTTTANTTNYKYNGEGIS